MRMTTWSRYGGYECSSKGDKRFSAFHAFMEDGRPIEHHYQCDIKGYDPGGRNWRLGKGNPPLEAMTIEELYAKYAELWRQWAVRHMEEMRSLYEQCRNHEYTLSDMFASTPINQAHALSDVLNQLIHDSQ